MNSPVLIIAVVVALLNLASVESFHDAELEETETERIVGGQAAAPRQFPFAAALYYNGRFICTGSIISPTTILTAAHCIVFEGENQPARYFHVILNLNRSADSVRINIASIMVHPEYNSMTLVNDIAILKTNETIVFTDDVRPVCIDSPDTGFIFPFIPRKIYKFADAVGWGTVSRTNRTQLPDILQYAKQEVVPNKLCRLFYPTLSSEQICAKGLFTGVCYGDSGGPLVHIRSNKTIQIGVSSFIFRFTGCGSIIPAVWARVSSYYHWIMRTANDSSICSG